MARKNANGEGSRPRQRADGRWEARYWKDGKRRRIYGGTRKETADKLAKAMANNDEPRAFKSSNMTRHTCTCILLLEGVNPKSVAMQMGWSSVAFMLENYARFLPGWGDNGVMDEALGG